MHPPLLTQSAKLAITCPASQINPQFLNTAKKLLQAENFELIIDQTCYYASNNYFAAPDKLRLASLQKLIDDNQIQGILMGRGGYGITRIIDELNWEQFKQYPKWIIGFSDITLLHLAIYQYCGCQSVHGGMLEYLSDSQSLTSLVALLRTGEYRYEFESNSYNRPGLARGILLGGNLSLITHSIGSPYFPNFKDSILLLEDINENLHSLDRMLWQLARTGIFANLKGLVCGYFTNIQDNSPSFGQNIYELITHHLRDYNFPIAFNFSAGHQKPNLALCLGARHKLEVKKDLSHLQVIS